MAIDASPRAVLPVVRRPLSPLERWYWIADQVSPLNVIARVRVTGQLAPALLRQALDALRVRHPLLRVAIESGVDGPSFVPTDAPIPLRRVAGTADDDWLRQINEHEMVEAVDWRTGPLCRTVVVANGDVHDLILTLPHCIADGTTVLSLVKDWLTLAAGRGSDVREPGLPACEEMFPRRHRGRAGARRLRWQRSRDGRRLRRLRPARVEPSEFVPFTDRRTRVVHRSLSADQVEALLRACRRERTTVHGVLAAAMVAAVAGDGPESPAGVAIGSPINFRDGLVPPVPDTAVGTYVATVGSLVPVETSLWSMARTISRDLVRRRRRGEHFGMVNLVGGSCPMSVEESAPLIEFIETQGPVNLCISNIGRYDFPDSIGPWRLSGAQFLAGLSVCGYFVSTVNTSHDRLHWNFSYVDGGLPRDRAERLVAASFDAVLGALGEE